MGIHEDARKGTLVGDRLVNYIKNNPRILDERDLTQGLTPLAVATVEGHADVVKQLLKGGAKADALSRDGETPLLLAAWKTDYNRARIVQLILAKTPPGSVDLTCAKAKNNTPLMFVIKKKDVEAIRLLRKAGASLMLTNDDDENAEYMAEETADIKVVHALDPDREQFDLSKLAVMVVTFIQNLILAWVNAAAEGIIRRVYNLDPVMNQDLDRIVNPSKQPSNAQFMDSVGNGPDQPRNPPSMGDINAGPKQPNKPFVANVDTSLKQPSKQFAASGDSGSKQPSNAQLVVTADNGPKQPSKQFAANVENRPKQPSKQYAAYVGTGAEQAQFVTTFDTSPRPSRSAQSVVNVDTSLKQLRNAQFVENVGKFVNEEPALLNFFKDKKDYLRDLAQKAADLESDPRTPLGQKDLLPKTIKVSLHQQVIYCDDSSSMKREGRWESQKRLVERITNITTRVLPEGEGVALRFINQEVDGSTSLTGAEIRDILGPMQWKPNGETQIGTFLRYRILEPLVYRKLRSKSLERPLLISIITDGAPSKEKKSALVDAIVECGSKLEDADYPRNSVKFLVGQVGTTESARDFLETIRDNRQIAKVVYCTSNQLDATMQSFRTNEWELDRWLIEILYSPIKDREK